MGKKDFDQSDEDFITEICMQATSNGNSRSQSSREKDGYSAAEMSDGKKK